VAHALSLAMRDTPQSVQSPRAAALGRVGAQIGLVSPLSAMRISSPRLLSINYDSFCRIAKGARPIGNGLKKRLPIVYRKQRQERMRLLTLFPYEDGPAPLPQAEGDCGASWGTKDACRNLLQLTKWWTAEVV
jgi:hypothetical protein